jgi:phage tail sheath protein FI
MPRRSLGEGGLEPVMTNSPTITETTAPPPIAPAPTSIALFIGWAPSGPTDHAVRIASFADYEAAFGTLNDPRSLLGYALYHFFDNGGTDAFALRIVGADGGFIAPADPTFVKALNAAFAADAPIAAIESFNLICIPGLTDATAIAMLQAKAVARRAFLIADCEERATVASFPAALTALTGTNATNSALYFSWVLALDPLQDNVSRAFPPCGFVAGVYAHTDSTRGVWNAPAGLGASLTDAVDLKVHVSDADQGRLNSLGVNCLRVFPVGGLVVWGARTLAGNDLSDWKYVSVRRLAIFLEDSIHNGTKWAVLEPNGAALWAKLRASIDAFMLGLWRNGAFQGSSASTAYFVRCDATTTTLADIENGVVNIVIGFAPTRPAEFVIMTIPLQAGSN